MTSEPSVPPPANEMHRETAPVAGGRRAPPQLQTFEDAKTFEPDRYASALLVTDPANREALRALAAFSAELIRIPRVVTEAMMGEIRLQWWRDVLAQSSDGDPDPSAAHVGDAQSHPLAQSLHVTRVRFALPVPVLTAMTEARSFDLYPDLMPDEATLQAYLMKTEGLIFSLGARILDVEDPPQNLITAASNAYGLVRLLQNLPYALSRGRIPLPVDRLSRAGTSPEALLQGTWNAAIERLRDDLLDDARRAYEAAKVQTQVLPRSVLPAFLPIALVPAQIEFIARARGDWLKRPPSLTPFGRYWRLWRADRRGSI